MDKWSLLGPSGDDDEWSLAADIAASRSFVLLHWVMPTSCFDPLEALQDILLVPCDSLLPTEEALQENLLCDWLLSTSCFDSVEALQDILLCDIEATIPVNPSPVDSLTLLLMDVAFSTTRNNESYSSWSSVSLSPLSGNIMMTAVKM